MPKTLPRSTHYLFCLLSAAWHTYEKPHWLYMVHHNTVIDKPSQVECILLPTVGNLWRKQWTEHRMASAQGWADCSHNESEANVQTMLKPVPVTATEETEHTSRGELKSLQDSALRLCRAIWDYLAVRQACDRAPCFKRIQFMLCTRMTWPREDQGPLPPKTTHSEGPQNNLACYIVYRRYL